MADILTRIEAYKREEIAAAKRAHPRAEVEAAARRAAGRRVAPDDAAPGGAPDRDFRRLYGTDPEPGTIMTAILEGSQVIDGFRHIRDLRLWLAKATSQAEGLFMRIKPNV